MRKLFFLLIISQFAWGQKVTLSEQAEISLITCGPGQNELYSAFGHSAVRVKDPVLGMDLVFNYGVFDFDQPNFYLNFARGHLLYMLAVNRWSRFLSLYQREGRYVRQQVLNLNPLQKQAYWKYLQWNAQEANRAYLYDYFYDNCATRPRYALEQALGAEQLLFSDRSYYQPPKSIRQLCDLYLEQQAWGDLGIDLCLGLPMDKQADAEIETFLPDLQAEAFAKAQLKDGATLKPLVAKDELILQEKPKTRQSSLGPLFYTSLLLVIGVIATILAYFKLRYLAFFDAFLFGLSGLLGLFLIALWFFTDHRAAAWNFNILVFNPLALVLALNILRKRSSIWMLQVMRFTPYYYALLLASWLWLPQQLPLSLMPLAALFILRAWHLYYRRDQWLKKPRQ